MEPQQTMNNAFAEMREQFNQVNALLASMKAQMEKDNAEFKAELASMKKEIAILKKMAKGKGDVPGKSLQKRLRELTMAKSVSGHRPAAGAGPQAAATWSAPAANPAKATMSHAEVLAAAAGRLPVPSSKKSARKKSATTSTATARAKAAAKAAEEKLAIRVRTSKNITKAGAAVGKKVKKEPRVTDAAEIQACLADPAKIGEAMAKHRTKARATFASKKKSS